MSFLSILSKVAQIGGSLISQLVNPANLNNSEGIPNTTIGNILYSVDPNTKEINASNLGFNDGETSISYTKTDDEGKTTTVIQPLPPGKTYNASGDIIEFQTGQVALAPSSVPTNSMTTSPLLRQILVSIPALFAAKVLLTSKISLQKTSDGFEINSESILDNVSISYQDKNGKSFTISGKSKSNSESEPIPPVTIRFPAGSSFDLPFNNLSITITMPTSSYEEITAERRQNLLDISEVPYLANFYNSALNKALLS